MAAPQLDPADRALRMVEEAASRADLNGAGGEVLRVRTSIHVELPQADVVARGDVVVEHDGPGQLVIERGRQLGE